MAHKPPHEANIAGSIFLLCSTTLGAGILAMPSVYDLIGLGLGSIALAFFGIVTAYSIWLLLTAGEEVGIKDSYEELLEFAFPKVGRLMTSIFIQLGLIGALTAFLVIIGDELSATISLLIETSSEEWYTSREFLIIIFVIVVIFPLSILKDISLLEYTAFVSVFIIFCFVVVVTILGGRLVHLDLVKNIKDFEFTVNSIFAATPTVSLAYTCQTSVFPIWKELRNPTKARMNTVQLTGSTIACVFYIIAGSFGYIYQPVKTPGNFLEALPSGLFYQIFRIFFAIAIVFHYPVVHYAFRNSVTMTFFPGRDFSWIRHTIITAIIMALTTFISLVIPDLGKVFALTGALAAYPIDFLLPALAYSKIVLFDPRGRKLARLRSRGRYSPIDAEESINEILASKSAEDSEENEIKGKCLRLLDLRFFFPFLMIVGSIASSVISLYVIISTTDWTTVFTKKSS